MTALARPIPALYTVYILRSTVRHASLYIGSTPNPPRRLKQHNGEVRGGAARTSRPSLRPWEMVALVSGFPGMVAALKFEWALNNPHLSLHIPSESRISVSAGTKKNGHPRRPRQNMASTLSNLHLLLRVPSFTRWPLRLHFFANDVHKSWLDQCKDAPEALRPTLQVVVDDSSQPCTAGAEQDGGSAASGIHALALDYAPIRPYVEKAKSIIEFEREGNCVVCCKELAPGNGLYAVCPNEGCEGVGHVDCWSSHLRGQEDDKEAVLPIAGRCPKCNGLVAWKGMMTELSLRTRGQNEIEKLLRRRRGVVLTKS